MRGKLNSLKLKTLFWHYKSDKTKISSIPQILSDIVLESKVI